LTIARALLFLALLSASVDRPGWKVIGPGGGGAQFHPTVSPHDPNRVLVSCDMTGAYLTEDGGASWRMVNFGSTVRFFAFDRKQPNVVYAQTTRLWRSQDGGRHWTPIYPAGARVEIDGDHAEEVVKAAEPQVDALEASGDVLWAAMGNGLRRSEDGGRTWTKVADLSGSARRIYTEGGAVYVLGAGYVAVHRGGALAVHPHEAASDEALGFDGGRPLFYYATAAGVFRSGDGEHWRKTKLEAKVRALDACRRDGKIVYASYEGVGFGVAYTSDAGETWDLRWQESRTRSPNVDVGGWVSDRFGAHWGEQPLAVAVAPSDPARAWGTDMGRALATTDSGKTWKAVYTRRLEDGSYTSTGLDVTTTYGVHFDPFDPKHMFISYTDIGLFASENGGKSWRSATTRGVPREWVIRRTGWNSIRT
jgi:hypothetical protein